MSDIERLAAEILRQSRRHNIEDFDSEINWLARCVADAKDKVRPASSQGGQGAEVVDVTHFGKGELVVSRGKYGNKPAVFVSPVQNGPGVVGEHPGDREPNCDPYLRPGEWVMTFPTHEQAAWVCKALWNQLNTHPQPAVPEGWKLVPVDPTIDMAEMGGSKAMHGMDFERAQNVWAEMLKWAPATPATPQADVCQCIGAGNGCGCERCDDAPQADGRVRCEDRLPTDLDADAEGKVWIFDTAKNSWFRGNYGEICLPRDSHWMPTGLKRPQPPKEGA